MRVTQRIHCDAAEKIEVLFPVGIKHIAATPMRQHERRTLVRRQQKLVGLGNTRINLRRSSVSSFSRACFLRDRL